MDREEILSTLADIPLFQDLSRDQLSLIADGAHEMHVKRKSFVFHKGDLCKGLYIVIKGKVKRAFFSPEGKEHVVRIMETGQSFADSVMFINEPHPASAQAISNARVLFISKEAIFRCMDENPALARNMLKGLNRRLVDHSTEREAITLHTATQRVVGYLLKSRDEDQPDFGRKFVVLSANRATIAAHLNMTPETFSRVMNALCEEGLISKSGKVIKILQMEKLGLYTYTS